MLMYNLFEYTDNYSMTSRSFCNYYRDEVNNDGNENNDAGNYRINNNKTTTSKSFGHKTKITGGKPNNNNSSLNAAPLKYLINFGCNINN